MFSRLLVIPFVLLAAPVPGRAAVVVIANYTDGEVAFQLAEPGAKAKPHKLPSNHVAPFFVAGPADLTFTPNGKPTTLRLDLYNAYAFLPDGDGGFVLEGLELPGDPLDRDARPEVNPAPRDPPKVPVTLLVDDADPRADQAWQAALRKRFDEAAAVIEAGAGVRLVLAGFDTWKSSAEARTTSELLPELERAVKPKAGGLVVGYTSRAFDPKAEPGFGSGRGLAGRHVVIREWVPKNEVERTEVLIHFLAKALGAVGSPDPGSALRSDLGDGYAVHAGAVLRLDPLNALVLNLWADERRRNPGATLEAIGRPNRVRITRVYQALRKAAAGDPLAIEYLDALERGAAPKELPRAPVGAGARDAVARAVVAAVRERAKANAAAGPKRLKGDALTAAYVKAAAEAALRSPGPAAVPGFLVGLGAALDDTGAGTFETDAEWKDRLAALGNPTLAGRRDLCRRFFLGAASNALAPEDAETAAVGRSVAEMNGPANLCLPALAAELAGGAFARAAFDDPDLLYVVAKSFPAAEYLPPTNGLRDGLSAEKFAVLYGTTSDDRFRAVLADIRSRLRELKAYR